MTGGGYETSVIRADADFDYIRRLVRERSSIVLESNKAYLAESRLIPLAKREGMRSLNELVARLRGEKFGGLHRKVVEAMTTNETSFFRDIHPFEALKKPILPELITRRASERKLNIWCAACSTGQEPYTIAMLLRESFPQLGGYSVRIVATDLSTEVLDRAREGVYSQIEVNRGLPAALLVKYFKKQGLHWKIADDLRRMVEFRELNLAESWALLGSMDIIFLRNVLIYFDVSTKQGILAKVRTSLRPDGYLFLGAAETTINLDDAFQRVQLDKSGCYRLARA
jgi:chemotaxis protein methyltransferase CheR